MTLVDFDRYESGNIRAQNILPGDVGKSKVQAQARHLRQIAPGLQIRPKHARFEELTLSEVRSDLLVSCLDSRIARTHLNEAAFRLNAPLLDGAVQGSTLQGRVAVFLPGTETPCLECQFSDRDYAALEQVDSCSGPSRAAPTNAPAALGAIVAGMQATEILKVAEGRWNQVLVDRQVFVDFNYHKQYVTRFCRNPNCRFDHQVWSIKQLDSEAGPRNLVELARVMHPDTSPAETCENSLRLRVRGQSFVRRLVCPGCRQMQQVLMLERCLATSPGTCAACNGPMLVSGFDKTEWLDLATVQRRDLTRSLASLGFRRGDVLTIRDGGGDRHLEWQGRTARAKNAEKVQQV